MRGLDGLQAPQSQGTANGGPVPPHIERMLNSSVRVPQSVVYRSLAEETVALNIETGRYYGLNLSAGRMLDTLDKIGHVRQAAVLLAQEFEQPLETIERDLGDFCNKLVTKGLLEKIAPAA